MSEKDKTDKEVAEAEAKIKAMQRDKASIPQAEPVKSKDVATQPVDIKVDHLKQLPPPVIKPTQPVQPAQPANPLAVQQILGATRNRTVEGDKIVLVVAGSMFNLSREEASFLSRMLATAVESSRD